MVITFLRQKSAVYSFSAWINKIKSGQVLMQLKISQSFEKMGTTANAFTLTTTIIPSVATTGLTATQKYATS